LRVSSDQAEAVNTVGKNNEVALREVRLYK